MNREQILKELHFKAVRSSGPGGQHVNKTSSKVEVALSIADSHGLSDLEKERLLEKLSKRLNKEGVLQLQCGESRSQHRNKAILIDRLFHILETNVKRPKKRKKTKPSRSATEKRLKAKKDLALKKSRRKKSGWDES